MENHPFSKENFESTFKAYFGPLCNYVNTYIKDWERSRKIVQSTFVKIWKDRNVVSDAVSAKSHLYASCRNDMIDYIRSNHPDVAEMELIDIEDNEDLFDRQILRQAILDSLDRLKPKKRKIFVLSKIEGLSHDEIASYLNIPKKTVANSVARALVTIKESLNERDLLETNSHSN